MNTAITGSMQQQQAEFQVPAEQSSQHGHREPDQHQAMESTFPSELALCYETLSVKEADERADGHVERSEESQVRKDMAVPVSALEAAVEKGKAVLREILGVLNQTHVSTGDTDWRDAISELLESARKPKVVIGVLGATGAGKSSLINAIIDEKGMLATNCMRAATAVATEVAYNDGPRRYKAEVQFIQPEEWKRELEVMCHEMLDENPDINAIKTTREKIKAVYPELDNGNPADTTMERLLGHPRIANLLGSSLLIEEDDTRIFADKLKPYIDSKSGTAREDAGLWPLTKTVRLYVKAQTLATGAVLVDLPGLYDSNAARVAVADDYLKRCAAHWVVAPINRAVDDKIAQSLVNKHLKSQMIFDCICDSLTFICTKTDDISVTEVQMGLGLESPSFDREEKEKHDLSTEVQMLDEEKARVERLLNETQDHIDSLEDGSTNYPQPSSLKRRWKSDAESILAEFPVSQASACAAITPEGSEAAQTPTPASKEEILREHKARKSELRKRRNYLIQLRKVKGEHLEALTVDLAQKHVSNIQTSIRERNNYSKKEITRHFQHLNRENDNRILHGKSELEGALPVFCVSTKAYQKLQGRLQKNEPGVAGFTELEQTEIPQLQAHCIRLTEGPRKASSKLFLIELKKLLQSMSLWSSATGSAHVLPDAKKQEMEAGYKEAGMRELQDQLFASLRRTFAGNILQKLENACQHGTQGFREVVANWNEEVHWSTYRAICRRSGVWKGYNWNSKVAHPMLEYIRSYWIRMVNEEIPLHLQIFSQNIGTCLDIFHKHIVSSADETIAHQNNTELQKTLGTAANSLRHQVKETEESLRIQQKTANRLFIGVIAAELEGTFWRCANQVRYVLFILSEVNGAQILEKSAQRASEELSNILKQTEDKITCMVRATVRELARDYHTAIIAPQTSEQEMQLKLEVAEAIRKAEQHLMLDELNLSVEDGQATTNDSLGSGGDGAISQRADWGSGGSRE
ncbi:hypothetical protein IFM58399_02648 [Aspergillus lentulus]|uniref:uncharacterized protein n=1 Tax=Aspergillus lentulus TaxID=293939 RepID=UPI001392A18E|nr:uncharacterized protein IFM58399_02648 [Aspergillus lentulus]GFF30677.1 hypothetical protein IFM58399_02648 [Aspergillus lentulus]GFF52362.1 hypothetical protein IFM62136_02032 [Aspergillus lentulus]